MLYLLFNLVRSDSSCTSVTTSCTSIVFQNSHFEHNKKTKISFVYNSYCKNFEIHCGFYNPQCKKFWNILGVVQPAIQKNFKNELRVVQPVMCFKIFYIADCRTCNAFFQIFTLRVLQPAMHLKKFVLRVLQPAMHLKFLLSTRKKNNLFL